jgi:uncharacterized protein YndB with AHSA1/START domain
VRKVLAWIAGVIILLLVVVLGVGYWLPVAHVETRSAAFAHPPDRVFAAIADIENYPRWRSDVDAVEVLAWEPRVRWREYGDDPITFERVEIRPPSRLVTRIADPDLPFGGTWTFELAEEGKGTRLTITEHGEVYSPLFRFMSRYVFGHGATLERFLADLERRLPGPP